ncbi:hypothetical protein TVAG_399850 [Trichomonas vaginalis G3]|uniref:Uncharacterized protein n=1 Tax=Trichomonas vaginalis (strain ATCC PRA-98 / G3) TaxID=412133 RepID=A2G8G8_TRIV3|nr:hypothetical protein TVAGG3_0582910 [Trichomonas vaginalis G3]EAX86551.1 hypothetical protein TVAG_399850 [Trichomonas vaginalis G3]KAI5522699.1 hypothetical protein TVAGG3_0582910 [Trichomonas vaginalis G3]|eukprot:XP_001299481.1 hypothetical protein [Trichomonas vaginalis G3]
MTTQNQLQRLSLDKNVFWTGTLQINDMGGHVFFDVRVKKAVPDAPAMIGLYTNDIPPFPLSSTDTLNIAFTLEVNEGYSAVRTEIVKASLLGSELHQAIEAQNPKGSINFVNETGEWQFDCLDGIWCLKWVVIYAPTANVKEICRDI